MNRNVFLISIIVVFFCTEVNAGSLFSEKSKSKWVYILANKSVEPDSLFRFENNILKVSDVSTGYIRTRKMYSDFNLSVEWRWTKVKANSGVLVHIQPKDCIWPICYQVQQKVDAAGDIICMNGVWAKECVDKVKFTVPKQKPSNEKPLRDWNSLLIKSKNGILEVYINGVLQNSISQITVKKGFIGFQAEGKPLEFRNLVIK